MREREQPWQDASSLQFDWSAGSGKVGVRKEQTGRSVSATTTSCSYYGDVASIAIQGQVTLA